MKKYIWAAGALTVAALTVFLLLGKTDNVPPAEEEPAEKLISVPAICQYPELPTGCEAVAATMALRFCGIDITAEQFARDWLECDGFYTVGETLYGPDPYEVFAGDPFGEFSFGCYAPVIADAVGRNTRDVTAEVVATDSVYELCERFIDNDRPVLIWATVGMKASETGRTWMLQDGREFTWIQGEHCLVLVGYSRDYYFLADPQSGSTVAYQKDIVEQRFSELGRQAVCIYKGTDTQ